MDSYIKIYSSIQAMQSSRVVKLQEKSKGRSIEVY